MQLPGTRLAQGCVHTTQDIVLIGDFPKLPRYYPTFQVRHEAASCLFTTLLKNNTFDSSPLLKVRFLFRIHLLGQGLVGNIQGHMRSIVHKLL